MTYAERLVRTLLCAQVPLVAGVALPFLGFVVLLCLWGGISLAVVAYQLFFAARLYTYGLAAVLLFGAPVYALLSRLGLAGWLTAALVGIAPGIAALLIGIFQAVDGPPQTSRSVPSSWLAASSSRLRRTR